MSATLIGIALGQLVIGSISDRLGRRIPALVGTGAFVVLSVLCAVAPSLQVLVTLAGRRRSVDRASAPASG